MAEDRLDRLINEVRDEEETRLDRLIGEVRTEDSTDRLIGEVKAERAREARGRLESQPFRGTFLGPETPFARGLQSGFAGLEKTAGSVLDTLLPGQPFQDRASELEAQVDVIPEPETTAGKAAQFAGEALPDLAAGTGALVAGGPVLGFGLFESLREAENGIPSIGGFARGVFLGGAFKASELFEGRAARAALPAVVGGGVTAAEGGDLKDVGISAALLGGLGAVAGKGRRGRLTKQQDEAIEREAEKSAEIALRNLRQGRTSESEAAAEQIIREIGLQRGERKEVLERLRRELKDELDRAREVPNADRRALFEEVGSTQETDRAISQALTPQIPGTGPNPAIENLTNQFRFLSEGDSRIQGRNLLLNAMKLRRETVAKDQIRWLANRIKQAPERRLLSEEERQQLARSFSDDPRDLADFAEFFDTEELLAAEVLRRLVSRNIDKVIPSDLATPTGRLFQDLAGRLVGTAKHPGELGNLLLAESNIIRLVRGAGRRMGQALQARQDILPLKEKGLKRREGQIRGILDATDREKSLYLLKLKGMSSEEAARFRMEIYTRGLSRPQQVEMLLRTVYINNLLSSPRTVALGGVNTTSGLLINGFRGIERGLAGRIGSLRTKGQKGAQALDRVFVGEGAAERGAFKDEMFGLINGSGRSFRAGLETFRRNDAPLDRFISLSSQKFSTRRSQEQLERALSFTGMDKTLANIMTLPGRAIKSGDSFIRVMAGEQAIQREAFRQASRERITDPVRFAARVQEIVSSPTQEMLEIANKEARTATFLRDPDELIAGFRFIAKKAQSVQNTPILSFFAPFARVGIDILEFAFRKSGLHATGVFASQGAKRAVRNSAQLQKFFRDSYTPLGGREVDEKLAEMSIGLLGMTSAFTAAKMGDFITGGGPIDPELRKNWLINHRPYSVRIPKKVADALQIEGPRNRTGDAWLSYRLLEPVATIIGLSADLGDLQSQASTIEDREIREEAQKRLDDGYKVVLGIFFHNLGSKTFLSSLTDFFKMIDRPEEGLGGAGKRTLINVGANLVVPGSRFLAQIERGVDPELRETRPLAQDREGVTAELKGMANDLITQIQGDIPGWSKSLPRRYNALGEPILLDNGLGVNAVSPVFSTRFSESPEASLLEELGVKITPLNRSVQVSPFGTPEDPDRRIGFIKLNQRQFSELQRITGQIYKAKIQARRQSTLFNEATAKEKKLTLQDDLRAARKEARQIILRGIDAFSDAFDTTVTPTPSQPGDEFATATPIPPEQRQFKQDLSITEGQRRKLIKDFPRRTPRKE